MNPIRIFSLIFLFSFVTLFSCNRQKSNDFWNTYKAGLIVNSVSEDLPDDLKSFNIQWSSGQEGTFKENEVLAFAKQNGWVPTDTLKLSTSDMASWETDTTPTFTIFVDSIHLNQEYENEGMYCEFERLITSDLTLYRFKTKNYLTSFRANISSNENGYMLISKDGKEMSLYQFWNE